MRRAVGLSLLMIGLAGNRWPLSAQVAAGEITGVVRDQAGAVVPGVTVTVTHIETNGQRVVASSGNGVYAFCA